MSESERLYQLDCGDDRPTEPLIVTELSKWCERETWLDFVFVMYPVSGFIWEREDQMSGRIHTTPSMIESTA